MFRPNNLYLISDSGNATSPRVYGYESSEDTIDVIFNKNYFALTDDGYVTPSRLQGMLPNNSSLRVTDAKGNPYDLVVLNQNGTITLSSNHLVALQNFFIYTGNAGVAPAIAYDFPPASILLMIRAVVTTGTTGGGGITFKCAKGTDINNTSKLISNVSFGALQSIYWYPAITTTNNANRVFNGQPLNDGSIVTNNPDQTLTYQLSAGFNGNCTIKVITYFIPTVN